MIEIKELSKDHIARANMNSFGGKRGDITAHEYEVYCQRVISWELSERKTQKILDRVFDYFSRSISLESQHVSVAVAGGSNYNAKRLDKSDKIFANASAFCEWFNDLEKQATKKALSRAGWLAKEIVWGVNAGYSTNKEWKELAGRDRGFFEALYNRLSEECEFKKTSIPYKIYHNLIEVEKVEQITLYADGDFTAYEEQGKISIDFRLKPQRQLIVALKSRGFAWIAAHSVWRANATDEIRSWVLTIAEKYIDYI